MTHKEAERIKFILLGWNDLEIKQHFKEGLAFTNAEGRLIRTENLKRNFTDLLKAAGLERTRFYDMRHAFAILSLQQGIDIKTLLSDMGHESIPRIIRNFELLG